MLKAKWVKATLAVALLASSARADLITNGGFETNTGNGQVGYNTSATGWTVNGGYTFLYGPGTADTTGADGQYGNVSLWGPGNGVANGLTDSPDGGYFIAQDSSFQQSPISQTITGLTVGQQYEVSFYWALAQQTNFFGETFDEWQVSLGNETQTTGTLSIPNQGFSGWFQVNMTFTAQSTSDVLSFFANGGPSGGEPPFALLDGVSMNAVPEPSSMALGCFGLMSMAVGALRRRAKAKAEA